MSADFMPSRLQSSAEVYKRKSDVVFAFKGNFASITEARNFWLEK